MSSLTELDLTLKELAKLDKIKVTFDLKKKQIEMSSTSETKNGKPLFEWSVDTLSGIVSETKRNDETQVSVTTEKQIDPNSLSRDAARTSSNEQSQE